MLAETVKGKSLDEVQEMAQHIKQLLKGDVEEPREDIGDLGALKGVRQFPVRIKCALLAWVTLIEGLQKYGGAATDGKVILSGDQDH
jgi:nitrogen fixation NifU-like protein